MSSPKRVVIVAGEESGDAHAADIVKELLSKHPTLQISGIGGHHMEAAGVELVYDLARYGVTGISEVIKHAFTIRKAFRAIQAHLVKIKPDLLILVDYPGFNLRLAQYAKQVLGIRILYYISPQIWAWKAKRIHKIKANVDTMAVILPFEKKIYTDAGVPVAFVGHPLVKKIPDKFDIEETRKSLGLPLDKSLVAMLPGSRNNEIERLLPVLAKTIDILTKKPNNFHVVIPIAATLDAEKVTNYFPRNPSHITFIDSQAIPVVACSDCVVVASGTASLECALLIKPMCIIYKVSSLTYTAAVKLIKVPYLGLCNLLQGKMIVPELIQHDCNAKELSLMVENMLNDNALIQQMKKDLAELKQSLSSEQADCSMVSLIERELGI